MTNKQTNATQQKQKKANPMKKIGKSIKNTFIEMSSSLAGWIDDTGNQFAGKKSTKKSSQNAQTTPNKASASSAKNNS